MINKKITILILLPLFGACTKFMEETSADIVIPESISQYEELLYGGGYPAGSAGVSAVDSYNNLDIMTDLVGYNPVGGTFSPWNADNMTFRAFYRWEADMEQWNSSLLHGIWQKTYAAVMVCNTVINDLETAPIKTFENQEFRDHVQGQAFLLRAFHHFTLATLFAEPYRSDIDNEMGIPIKLEAGVVKGGIARNTVHQVFKQIRNDIDKGLSLIDKKTFDTPYTINYRAGLVLASRVALVMEDWQSVIKYGEEFTEIHPALAPLEGAYNDNNRFIQAKNVEVVFLYGASNPVTLLYNGQHPGFVVDEALFDLYKKDKKETEIDLRPTWFFTKNSTTGVPYPTKKQGTAGARGNAFRSAEVYLNLAEAYAKKEERAKSVQILNKLRKNRIHNAINLADANWKGETLMQLVKNERIRELCFEDQIRWMDLRRFQETVQHEWQLNGQHYRVVLTPEDKGYTLQIPKAELDRNPLLKMIQRPQRPVEVLNN